MLGFLKRKHLSDFQKESKRLDILEERWDIAKDNIFRKNQIQSEFIELKKKKTNKLTMSKKLMIFLFLNCTIVEIFTGYITLLDLRLAYSLGIMPDFSPLVTLIGAVVGEVIGLATYFAKSTKENTEGGIIYYNATQGKINDDDAVG